MATPQPTTAPQSTSVIDTGQSLGKNVKIQNGKIQLPTADIETSPRPLAPEVLGTTVAPGTTETTKTAPEIQMLEPHTYYSTPNNEVRLYSDASGQIWLTVSPVVAGLIFAVIIGLALLPILVSLTRQKMRRKAERRAERRALLAEMDAVKPAEAEELGEEPQDSEATEITPQKFRKISL